MIPILPFAKSGGGPFYPYTIDGSLRFNLAYLSRPFGSGGDRKAITLSIRGKRSNLDSAAADVLFSCYTASGSFAALSFNNDRLRYYEIVSSVDKIYKQSNAVYRDPSSSYHVILTIDSANSTASIYYNGQKVTSLLNDTDPSLNYESLLNSATLHILGSFGGSYAAPSGNYYDGYLTEVHFLDGIVMTDTGGVPDEFGEFKNGVWVPKAYTGGYGTNGFYLPLSTDALDDSGNGNDWTESPSIASTDYVLDSPTNNFATLNPLDTTLVTLADGNLKFTTSSSVTEHQSNGSIYTESGYFELICLANAGELSFGITSTPAKPYTISGRYGFDAGGFKIVDGVYSEATFSLTSSDILGVSFDSVAGTLDVYKNDSLYAQLTSIPSGKYTAFVRGSSGSLSSIGNINFGQDSSFAGNKTTGSANATDSNGIGDFYYAPPTGYLALCTANLEGSLPTDSLVTTSGSFTGNTNADGPFVYLGGVPETMTINGNAVTWGVHADKTANGFKVRTSSTSYNAAGSNTFSVSAVGSIFKFANAQEN